MATDKDTALQEHLGQQNNNESKLTPREVALTNPASETIVSVSGQLDKVFDLTNEKNLFPFTKIINKFVISNKLALMAKKLRIPKPEIIKTPTKLLKTFLDPNWRERPNNFDIPSNSQIFGHLVYTAGIEGILYPSKFTDKLCLAIYPRNFPNTDSFILIDDELPHNKVPKRIDGTNWRICELNANEIIG